MACRLEEYITELSKQVDPEVAKQLQGLLDNKVDNRSTNITEYVNHSGGAEGADTVWGDIGKQFNVRSNHYYMWVPGELNAPNGNTEISAKDMNEGKFEAAKAAKRNWGYQYSAMKDVRLVRNWAQVKYAEAIFAIGTIVEIGEKMFPNQRNDTRTAIAPSVAGGTGYAVGMAINHGKPVYVFDQNRNSWYEWNSQTKTFDKLKDTPTLTNNFAGIGTRKINPSGVQAVKDIYAKTFNGKLTGSKSTTNIYYNTSENAELSNLAVRPFILRGKEFQSVEHAYQSLKSGNLEHKVYDKDWSKGGLVARGTKGTKGTKEGSDKDWNINVLMKKLLVESFKQNPEAWDNLLATKGQTLTHTQGDQVWQEAFPRLLMEIRDGKTAPRSKEANVEAKPDTETTQKQASAQVNTIEEKEINENDSDDETTLTELDYITKLENKQARIMDEIENTVEYINDSEEFLVLDAKPNMSDLEVKRWEKLDGKLGTIVESYGTPEQQKALRYLVAGIDYTEVQNTTDTLTEEDYNNPGLLYDEVWKYSGVIYTFSRSGNALIGGETSKGGTLGYGAKAYDTYENVIKNGTLVSRNIVDYSADMSKQYGKEDISKKIPSKQKEVTKKDESKALSKYEIFPGVYANEDQRNAIDMIGEFLKRGNSQTSILLKGRGGTGKTSIISKVLSNSGIPSSEVHYITPTNKATKVLHQMAKKNNSAGESVFATVAQGLSYMLKNGSLVRKTNKFGEEIAPLITGGFFKGARVSGAKVVVVDESSMLTKSLQKELEAEANRNGIKIIYMGDNVQLAPVNDGGLQSNVFTDHNSSSSKVELNKRMRQSEDSGILPITDVLAETAESIVNKTGDEMTPVKEHKKIKFVDAGGSDVQFKNRVIKTIKEFVQNVEANPKGTRWIMFNNNQHPEGKKLTEHVRKLLFGDKAKEAYVVGEQLYVDEALYIDEEEVFSTGDEVTVVNIGNNSIKRFSAKEWDNNVKKYVNKDYTLPGKNLELKDNLSGDVVEVFVKTEETEKALSKLTQKTRSAISAQLLVSSPAYVLTSHKAQGSTYEKVYADIGNILGNGVTLDKVKSAYVATSRASKELVMVGVPENMIEFKPIIETPQAQPILGSGSVDKIVKKSEVKRSTIKNQKTDAGINTKFDKKLAKKIEDILKKLYPEIKLEYTEQEILHGEGLVNQETIFNEDGRIDPLNEGTDMVGVDLAFTNNPKLKEVGTKEEYKEYIKSIFPDSLQKGIVYHDTDFETKEGKPWFLTEDYDIKKAGKGSGLFDGEGMYFAANPDGDNERSNWSNMKYRVSALLNIHKPISVKEHTASGSAHSVWFRKTSAPENEYDNRSYEVNRIMEYAFGYDSKIGEMGGNDYIVWDKDNIHLLGSAKDVKGFHKWKKAGQIVPKQTKTYTASMLLDYAARVLEFYPLRYGSPNEDLEKHLIYNTEIPAAELEDKILNELTTILPDIYKVISVHVMEDDIDLPFKATIEGVNGVEYIPITREFLASLVTNTQKDALHGLVEEDLTIRQGEPVVAFQKIGNQIRGQADLDAKTVLINSLLQSQDTLPHEYAHHYIAMFRDAPIVQEAIKKWGSEEALVQAIGEQVVEQKGEAYGWWKKFSQWIQDKFNKLSDKSKEELRNILTDAFLTRENLAEEQTKRSSGTIHLKDRAEAEKADIERLEECL